jgi:Fic family protein
MLSAIDESLIDLLTNTNKLTTSKDRIEYFIEIYKQVTFSRKIYLEYIKDISTATASRDLKYGVEQKLITKRGDKNKTEYLIKRKK